MLSCDWAGIVYFYTRKKKRRYCDPSIRMLNIYIQCSTCSALSIVVSIFGPIQFSFVIMIYFVVRIFRHDLFKIKSEPKETAKWSTIATMNFWTFLVCSAHGLILIFSSALPRIPDIHSIFNLHTLSFKLMHQPITKWFNFFPFAKPSLIRKCNLIY